MQREPSTYPLFSRHPSTCRFVQSLKLQAICVSQSARCILILHSHLTDTGQPTQVQTTVRYAHLAPGYLAEAVERLAAPAGGQTDTPIDTGEIEALAKVG